MNADERNSRSKFLSYVLRHNPGSVGISLDRAGWANVDELLRAAAEAGHPLTLDELQEVVTTSAKQRFSFNDDGTQIRANQGHSVDVQLGLTPCSPPELLYHGTPLKFVDAIREHGLLKMSRHAVHLSADPATAAEVGRRRGEAVVLIVAAGQMHADAVEFHVSDNGVWLVDHVPPNYIEFPKDR